MKIFYTRKFVSLYENLSPLIKLKAERQERIFKENIFYPSLNTEKLMPKKNNLWSFRVDGTYRIVFNFEGDSATFIYRASQRYL